MKGILLTIAYVLPGIMAILTILVAYPSILLNTKDKSDRIMFVAIGKSYRKKQKHS